MSPFYNPLQLDKYSSWKDSEAVLSFFNRVAHNRGFHPTLEYERWYNIKPTTFSQYKVSEHITIYDINYFFDREQMQFGSSIEASRKPL